MRRPWSVLDRMVSRKKLAGVVALSQITLPMTVDEPLDDSSSESSDSNASSIESDLFGAAAFQAAVLQAQGQLLLSAAEPFFRPKTTYAVGPERWSFARIERDFGTTASSCAATVSNGRALLFISSNRTVPQWH